MKKLGMLIIVSLLLLPAAAPAFPSKKGDKDCLACHKLDKKEAEALVKKVVATGIVVDIKAAPIKGVWQIDVDAGEGKRGPFYLDFSKKFVLAGQIIPVASLGKQQPPRRVDFSKIPLGDALLVGSPDAKKKVIVFTDPDCPYCRQLHAVMNQVVAKRRDISFSLILHPLPMHKDAPKKIQAILCSKSIEMLDNAFAGKYVPEPPAGCTTEAMERNKKLAQSLDFKGTPMLVRDDGMVLSGFLPEEKLLDWIDRKQ